MKHYNLKHNIKKSHSHTLISFIETSKKKHGNKYDYSDVNYIDRYTYVNIKCLVHGVFLQRPSDHLNGNGCKKCIGRYVSDTESFIIKANKIHNNRYIYDKTLYVKNSDKLEIFCKHHGYFQQFASIHLRGSGCPRCCNSRGELLIYKYLSSNSIEHIQQYTYKNCKNILCLRFDFYLPNYNILIEFNGLQHYKPINFFGGKKAFKKQVKKDNIKKKYCKDNNITLIIIRYDQNIFDALNAFLPLNRFSITQ